MSAVRRAHLILTSFMLGLAACSGSEPGTESPAANGGAGIAAAAALPAASGSPGAGANSSLGTSTGAVAVAGAAAHAASAAGGPPSPGAAGGGTGAAGTAGAVSVGGTPTAGGSAGTMPSSPNGAGGAAAQDGATFTKVFNLLAGGCATGGYCHAASGGMSKLALVDQTKAYMELVGVPGMGMAAASSAKMGCATSMIVRVKAGDPDNSLLMQKLEGKQTCGDVMPPGGMLLPDELKLVRDWIAAGAKND